MQFDKIVKSIVEGFGATYTTKNHFQCLKIYFKDASLAQFAYIMSVWNAADTGPVVAVKTCLRANWSWKKTMEPFTEVKP